MAQFDIRRFADSALIVDLQSDFIGLDVSRVVAPLRPSGVYGAIPRLTPRIEFEGRTHVVRLQEVLAVPASALGPVVGSALPWQDEIKEAIDVLFRGF